MNTTAIVPSVRALPALSPSDLRRIAPSIYAEHARPGVSSRYTFVSTAQVVDLLGNEGWLPVRASEQRVRREGRAGYQMHELRFARQVDLAARDRDVGSTRPELILQNAHDGSRAYRIDAGLYRLVCRNGLTVADVDFAHVSIRHVDVAPEAFIAAARSVAAHTPRALETVVRWQQVALTPAARAEFARRAAALRWDEASPVRLALNPDTLLRPVRMGDGGTDLWTTLNVVQEHLVRGGDRYTGLADDFRSRRNRTRPLAGIPEGQKLNKALWELAGQFAAN